MMAAVEDLLQRATYEEGQAARLLRVPQSTLRWWLEGRDHHPPVLRPEPTGDRTLTWGEFVEARYLTEYRRRGVPLQRIRPFVETLRRETGVLHPLATERPWIGDGRRLLLKAQHEVEVDVHLAAVYEVATGQLVLSPPAEAFLDVVEFDVDGHDGRVVRRLHPAGASSPVLIDPDLRAGLASVRGVSTTVIRELIEAGDAVEAVADDYGLDLDDTIAALDYERTLALPTAA
jgi:uncharacterized protein (DUF433 family)